MNADDVRKMLDSVFDLLSPAKAQELARGLLGDDRREQAQKLAGDLMDSAQRNRDRVRELISREVTAQMKSMGVATRGDLEALERRVQELERASGGSAASKRTSSGTRRGSSAGTAAPKRVAAGSPRAKRSAAGSSGSTAASPGSTAEPSTTRSSRAGSTRRQPPSPRPPTP
jgi:polyhydroxyalkanoate synthesis regulator phasin